MLLLPQMADAHGIGIEAKLKGGTVVVEAFYDDDTSAPGAAVTVEDDAKKVVVEGKTDAQGKWSFPAPKPGKYTVRVNAGDGHIARTTITIPPNETAPPTESGEQGKGADVGITISEGPTRSQFTGPMRWVMAAVGLALIATLTLLAGWISRRYRKAAS
jgi:hypothetical protein